MDISSFINNPTLLESVLPHLPYYIFWKNKKSEFVGCNMYFAHFAGYEDPKEIIGKTDADLPWHKYAETYHNDDKKVIDTGVALYNIKEKTQDSKGEHYTMLTHKIPLKINNKVEGLLGIASKLNAINTCQENSLLQDIIAHIPHYIFWKDTEGTFLGCNQQFAKSAGFFSAQCIVGKTDKDMPWKEQAKKYQEDDKEVISTGIPKLNIEDIQTRSDGKKIIALVSKVPLYDASGKVYGVLGIYTDITERKQYEYALKESKKKAEVSNALKSEFIQNMQHDIRTPTAAGIWSLLQLMHNEEQNPQKRESLGLLTNSAKQLLDFCNEIIDFDNVENSNRPFLIEKFDVHELARQIIELECAAAKIAKLDLTWQIDSDVPLVIKGDKFRLKRILINLISNALKFTKTGEVTLSISCAKKTNKQAYLTFKIHDTGPGISKSSRDFLFMDFTRGTPSAHNVTPGLGLGLRIVKKFVEEMHGEIDVNSIVGQGSDFYVTLPFSLPLLNKKTTKLPLTDTTNVTHPLEPASYDASPKKTFSGHLLIVEDDKIAQTIAERHFTDLGCTLHIASNLAEARKRFKEGSYHLIILDLGLPDGSGLAFAKEINNQGNQAPIIAVTAHSDPEKKKQAQQAGMTTLFTKPLTKQRAETILTTYLDPTLSPTSAKISEPTIDLDTGQTLIHGDKEQAKEMLEILVTSLHDTLDLLKLALDSEDFEAFQFETHKLKGALAYCGAPQLKYSVTRINEAISNNSKPADKASYIAFYEEILKDARALQNAFKALSKSK
ncbi:MAG: PAS domain-containing protein [Gammaproteobacteria bacterium]